jgi:hypothetical protein
MNEHLNILKGLINKAIRYKSDNRIEYLIERSRPEERKVEITFSIWISENDYASFKSLLTRAKELSEAETKGETKGL